MSDIDQQETTAMAERAPSSNALFANDHPSDIVSRATEVANVLAPIIQQKGLFKEISGKKHVMAEGWATLMGLLNVDPIVEYCRRIERDDEIIYEARVLLVKNGQTISAAETIASDKEKASWSRSEQGIKSMAQTRAFGKACRLKFSWIVVLAGYTATPAEEMTEDKPTIKPPQAKPKVEAPIEPEPVFSKPIGQKDTEDIEFGGFPPDEDDEVPNLPPAGVPIMPPTAGSPTRPKAVNPISDKQAKMLFAKCRSVGMPDLVRQAYIRDNFHVEHLAQLPWTAMDPMLKWITAFENLNANKD